MAARQHGSVYSTPSSAAWTDGRCRWTVGPLGTNCVSRSDHCSGDGSKGPAPVAAASSPTQIGHQLAGAHRLAQLALEIGSTHAGASQGGERVAEPGRGEPIGRGRDLRTGFRHWEQDQPGPSAAIACFSSSGSGRVAGHDVAAETGRPQNGIPVPQGPLDRLVLGRQGRRQHGEQLPPAPRRAGRRWDTDGKQSRSKVWLQSHGAGGCFSEHHTRSRRCTSAARVGKVYIGEGSGVCDWQEEAAGSASA